jgi:hypothetical protein
VTFILKHFRALRNPFLRISVIWSEPYFETVFGGHTSKTNFQVVRPTCGRAPDWLAGALFRLEVFGSNHASATKVSSLSNTSASPATIRICDFHR